jgi:D-alanine-D-alanine ligase
MKPLRVLALVHEELVPPDDLKGLTPEEIAPWKMEFDVRQALQQLGHEVRVLGVGDELAPIRDAIVEFEPHLVFNMLVQFHQTNAYASAVVSYLELLKIPYSGCNARGLLLAWDKVLSKKILTYHKVRVPRFLTVPRGRKVARAAKLRFPLIVKSVSEQASAGLAQASIVRNADSLQERVEFVHRSVGTAAIAEEYIEGRELTVGVLGNERLEVLPVWEMFFDKLPDGAAPIATSKVKWDAAYQRRIGLHTGPARDLPPELTREIDRVARRVYRALQLSGLARVDLRLDHEGKVWVLEANPNPDLTRGEDFAASAAHAGVGYEELLQRVLNLGLRYEPAWKGD